MNHRPISVRPLSPERAAALMAKPAPAPEPPTRFAGLSDAEVLALDLTPLSRSDALAVQQEMSQRKLYGN